MDSLSLSRFRLAVTQYLLRVSKEEIKRLKALLKKRNIQIKKLKAK